MANDNEHDGGEACGNCICFLALGTQQINKATVSTGICRLNPPTPVPVQTIPVAKKIVGPADQQQTDVQLRIEPICAPVHAAMWCRHHLTVDEYSFFKANLLGLVNEPPETEH